MRKIKLYIATSLDGYIATPAGELDWLIEYPNPNKQDYGYEEFYKTVDTVIMGGRTYHSILSMDVIWPYKDKETYIVTRHSSSNELDIQFITENVIEEITQLKEKEGDDIWLVGGGELVSMLLDNNLVDTMIITSIPTILGSGIPLFPNAPKSSDWEVISSQKYKNSVIATEYEIVKG